MAIINEANSDTINAMPNGASNRPSIPDKKNKGTKATIMMNVAFITELLISMEAS